MNEVNTKGQFFRASFGKNTPGSVLRSGGHPGDLDVRPQSKGLVKWGKLETVDM